MTQMSLPGREPEGICRLLAVLMEVSMQEQSEMLHFARYWSRFDPMSDVLTFAQLLKQPLRPIGTHAVHGTEKHHPRAQSKY